MNMEDLLIELSASIFSKDTKGTVLTADNKIKSKYYIKILPLINMAFKKIYSTFNILQESVIIRLQTGVTRYVLDSRHSVHNTSIPPAARYIDDSPFMPFKDNVVKILEIKDELGRSKYVNDYNQKWSVYTPDYNVIQHPYPNKENAIEVIFQAYPIPFTKQQLKDLGSFNDTKILDLKDINVNAPAEIEEAIIYYIGSKIHTFMNSAETMSEANFFKNVFAEQMALLRQNNIERITMPTDTSIRDKGFNYEN